MQRIALTFVICVLGTACERAMHPVVLHNAEQPPKQLSDWRVVFANGTSLELNERVVPYGLNTPLFTDYALKLRTVWLPEGTAG